MITGKVYKLRPYINNSFDKTLRVFTEYIMQDFEVIELKYNTDIIIDNTKIGTLYQNNMKRPEFIYITVLYCSNGAWANSGGLEFCNFKTKSDNIYVRWDTNKRKILFDNGKECEEINNNFFRKIKLEKLKNIK